MKQLVVDKSEKIEMNQDLTLSQHIAVPPIWEITKHISQSATLVHIRPMREKIQANS
jgi:hypothetical protein